jgi:hypothetical protein
MPLYSFEQVFFVGIRKCSLRTVVTDLYVKGLSKVELLIVRNLLKPPSTLVWKTAERPSLLGRKAHSWVTILLE